METTTKKKRSKRTKRTPKYTDKHLRVYYDGEELVPSPVFGMGSSGRVMQMCYRPSTQQMEWQEVQPVQNVRVRQDGGDYSVDIDIV